MLCEAATEKEREELMQALVVRVEMDEKEKGTCEVALLPQIPSPASDRSELTPKMGAGCTSLRTIHPSNLPILRSRAFREEQESCSNQVVLFHRFR